MNITREDIWTLPDEWAQELAESLDPDGDLIRAGISWHGIISENWPEVRHEVEELLAQLLENEACS